MEYAPKGVNPDIVRLISEKNEEPEWMTEWRLASLRTLAADGRAEMGDGRTIRKSIFRTSITMPVPRAWK